MERVKEEKRFRSPKVGKRVDLQVKLNGFKQNILLPEGISFSFKSKEERDNLTKRVNNLVDLYHGVASMTKVIPPHCWLEILNLQAERLK